MRISKLPDGAEGTRLPSWRPPQVAQLTAEAKQAVTVVVSNQIRALTSALAERLSDIGARGLDVLTQQDRLLLTWAAELAQAGGVDPEEVGKLTAELTRYRSQERVGHAVVRAREDIVTLARFTPREEAQARAILFGLATTQSTLEPGFVSALLDPDLRAHDGVSLGFVQRIVAAMPPGTSEAVAGLDLVYAQRDARIALGSTLDRLRLPALMLGEPSLERIELGAAMMRARLSASFSAARLATSTTSNDRALLVMLYVSQDERGGDLRLVDDVARALVALRRVAVQRAFVPRELAARVPDQQPAFAEDTPLAVGSAIQLAAKAAVAYRSVAPPRPNSVPPPMGSVPFTRSLTPAPPSPAAVFDFAQALGLSALVADVHRQLLRARRRRLFRRREVESVQDAASARETQAETSEDPTHTARRHARWRRLVRRRLAR